MTSTTGNQTLTLGDAAPTLIVLAVTVAATIAGWHLISVPGFAVTLVMVAVTLHPRHTLRSIARGRR